MNTTPSGSAAAPIASPIKAGTRILGHLTTEQCQKIAAAPNPKPMSGTWTLTAPDGRQWAAEDPIKCVIAEGNDRIPALVQLARLRCGIDGVDWHDDEDAAELGATP